MMSRQKRLGERFALFPPLSRFDASGRQNVLLSNGNPQISDSALHLDGSSFLKVTHNTSLDLASELTIACSWRQHALSVSGHLVSKLDSSLDKGNYLVETFTDGCLYYTWTSGIGGASNRTIYKSTSAIIVAGVESHLTLTHVSGSAPTLYQNGESVPLSLVSGTSSRSLTAYSLDFGIGADPNRSPTAGYSRGQLRSLVVLSQAVSQADAIALWQESLMLRNGPLRIIGTSPGFQSAWAARATTIAGVASGA